MSEKIKIIHIMDHLPAYEEHANISRPVINWDTPNGLWVGMAGYDWSDQIGSEILKLDFNISYEVWQPDLRADKIYNHTFEGGWTHLQFPAKEVTYWYGVKKQKYLASDSLIELLEKNITPNTILQLPFPNTPMIQSVIKSYRNTKVVCTCLGDLPLPSLRLWKLSKNPLSKVNLLREHFLIKGLMPYVNAFTIINHNHLDSLRKLFTGTYSIVPMGIDTNVWCWKEKAGCRSALNLPPDKTIFFSSSRLNSLKQVDKLIHLLNKLSASHEFLFILSGHGTRAYEEYLVRQAQPLVERKQILFTGYVSDAELLDYYNAADVFILTSLSEGSPVGVQKAFACRVPVLSTNVGYTSEIMQEHKAGIIIPKTDYVKWEEALVNILNGNLPRHLENTLVNKYFSWPNVAQQFIDVFKSL